MISPLELFNMTIGEQIDLLSLYSEEEQAQLTYESIIVMEGVVFKERQWR